MPKAKMPSLLDIKTIDDEEDVQYYSEDSDVEVEFQPTKQKNKQKVDFDTEFTFVATTEEYNKDVWNDLSKYVKRKAKTKTDDKIKKARTKLQDDAEAEIKKDLDEDDDMGGNDNNSDISLSEDELKRDNIKTKEKRKRKRKAEEEEQAAFFEEGDVAREVGTFYEMNLSRPLMKAIGEMKFVHPTPIQASTIPVALMGRDICGCAATGTGKTAAYMLPTLERLLFRPADNAVTRVLVLVPTRELGVQVYQVTKQLTQYTDIEVGLAVGGLDLKTQESVLRKSPDIVIATPGRLIDHLKSTPSFSLDSIEVLILDEADRMLDEYFAEQMKEIIRQCARTRQTMLFSATMTDAVNDLAAVSLTKPVKLFANSNREVAFNLRQEFVRIRNESDREAMLAALVCRTFRQHCIVFVQTKKQAHRLHIMLGLCGVRVVELHGNLTQPQRLEALAKFKKDEADVLVATDVAARGLDISGVQTVVNFVMPATLEHYIHRVGRTARAGRAGVSVSLAGERERKIVKDIIKRANNPVKSRMIPPEIVEKYKNRLEKIQPEIENILREEYEERMLSKAENQANRVQRLLAGDADAKRPWFQTKKERKDEQERLALVPKEKEGTSKKDAKNSKQKDKMGKKTGAKKGDKDGGNEELAKVALLQARLAKRKSRQKKLNTCKDDVAPVGGAKNKAKKSRFDRELTATSAKGAKMQRHKANAAIRNKNIKTGNKKGGGMAQKGNKKAPNAGGKGKAFGKPMAKKQRF